MPDLYNQSQVEGNKNYKNELKTKAYADLLLADSRGANYWCHWVLRVNPLRDTLLHKIGGSF